MNDRKNSSEKKNRNRKRSKKFTYSMQKKLVVLFLLVLLAFAYLGARLVVINRDSGQAYTMQVLSQQAYEDTTIPYKRGQILDSKGTVLADSQLVYNIIVDSKTILSKDAYLEPTLTALEQLGLDKETMRQFITTHTTSQYYIAKKELSFISKQTYDNWVNDGLAEEKEKNVKQKDSVYRNIKGIWFESGYKRVYPHSKLACHVLGFSNSNNVGFGGLEEYYNDTLNGIAGRSYGYLDESTNIESTRIEATDGDNLVLTIDANIQSIVQKYLDQFNVEHKNGDHDGNGANNVGCIMMDIDSGEILAMAGTPFFDLNDPSNLSSLIGMPKLSESDQETDQYLNFSDVVMLNEQDQARYLNALWRNFTISEYYEPGSTAKPFTVAAGLESGAVNKDDTFECEGYLNIDNFRIKCHNIYGDGLLTVGEAVERSCNVALMMMAESEGKETFTKFQNTFNFGLKTNIDLADEARTDQFVTDASSMTNATLATNSFGQNFDATMVQMVTGFCSLINGGNYYQPHIVSKITSASGSTIETVEPRILKKTVSEETSALIREYTLQVVEGENGTGKTARPAGYRVGGKTGTAETLPRNNGEYIVSFLGYAPAENPQIACYVVVDRPNVEHQDDAKYATEIFRNIMTEVLPYLNIQMTVPVTDSEREELEKKGLSVTYHEEDEEQSSDSE